MLLLCNYYVTYRCNAYCSFCHFADHEKYKKFVDADLNDFKNNVTQLKELGVKFIDLTGGEPLLNKNIVAMTKFARSLKLQTSITTNTLLYPKFAEGLCGQVNLLHFSMDSPDEDEHNNIRGISCYNSVLESIKIAKSLGEYPDILFTVTDSTYTKLPKMYDIAKKHDLVLIINPVFSYFGNSGLSKKAINYIEEFTQGKPDVYLNSAYLKLRKAGGNDKNKPLCKAVSRVIVISPDNKLLLPCYHFAKESIQIEKPISEIRKTELYKHYQSMQGRFDFCEGCTVNCYFEPSFAFPVNKYGIESLPSKIKYSYQKLVKQKFVKRTIPK